MSGTLARVATAAVLIPIVVAVVLWGPTWLVGAAVGLVTVLALVEFFALGEKIGMRGYMVWTSICSLLMIFSRWGAAERMMSDIGMSPFRHLSEFAHTFVEPDLVLLVFLVGLAAIVLGTQRPLGEVLTALSTSAAGLLLVAFPLSYLVLLRSGESLGPKVLLFVLVVVWVGDTSAYFIGRAVGRHAMAPQISPKKTWEGAVANFVGSLLVASISYQWMNIELKVLLGAAAVGSVAGQVGDLLESAYKRSAGVKDSGIALPGHGGFLDRIDALVLAAPAVWYYFSLPWLRWFR